MEEQQSIIIYFIKIFVINLFIFYCFTKLSNIKKITSKNILLIVISNFIITFINININIYINFISSILIMIMLYSILLSLTTKLKLGYILVVNVISYAICYVAFLISTLLSFIPYKLILIQIENSYLNLIIILAIQFILIYGFFKMKRFKNGFDFLRDKLNNDFTDIVVINISTIIVIIYCLIGNCIEFFNEEIVKNLVFSFIIIAITMIVTIQKTITMYYKQKLLKQTMKDYERELEEKDKEIERLKAEKFNISKITHEFYNRQKALEMAVKDNLNNEATLKESLSSEEIVKDGFSSEISEELSALDRIQDLTDEYSKKLKEMKSLPILPLTEIPEIDDMFKYMQSECDKNNIEFKLKIAGNMFYLINNIIPKNKLETMIGDHIRDSIIAINSSDTADREIFVILGIKDKKYELCIYDTGIEFEIETLLKLGLEPATTHKDTGGTGIGFLTTFETLKETKASLIIREELPLDGKHYTKAVIIRFDNKHQYKICSYRAEEIKKCNNKGRKILIEEK